ncbi:hypothetical protein BGAL_0054g00130 [Botrytis galanthina]|uniref:Uncharacterized protein n=1 Tax=Botrytis galanthina TaxID=278940 RepID=A0A4S8R8J1_9HELO|nr:hypothetical protein BGAL_0054g00130 [Botrytis galanthina]
MFHSSKSSKVTLHKKLFAPVSITSALGSGSSTEPKATIPVLLPAAPILETEMQAEVEIQTQEQNIVSVSSNPVSSITEPDLALPPAAVPTPGPNTHSTTDLVRLQDTKPENKVVANSIQVLPPSPPRSPFYSSSSASSSSLQSSHQSSTHRRNMSSTSTTTTQFGSPPPSYTPFVTNTLPPQTFPYHVQNQYGHTNGYRPPMGSNGFPAGNQFVNAPLNHQVIHRTGFASPSPSPSPGLQLPDLVDEVLRLRDRLNLLEGGALTVPGGRGRSMGRERDRREDVGSIEERKNKKAKEVERETREAKERWEEIEKCGLGYEDFLDEFFGNDYSDWKIEKFDFEEEEIQGSLRVELGGVKLVDEVCDVEENSGDVYEDEEEEGGKEEEEEEEQEETESEEDEDEESETEEESSEEQSAEEEKTPNLEDTITLLPSVFVDERTNSRLHPSRSSSSSTFSSYFPRSSAPSTPRYNQQKVQEPPLKSTPVAPDPPRSMQRERDPSLPEYGCYYFVDAGSIQNITVIYPVTSLPQSVDALEEEKEVIRCVLEGWNRGNIDKYGHRPSKRAYAAIIYPDPQAPLPRKKLRVALSFTPIYPPTSSIYPIPTTQTPTNPEDITTDTSIYISTTNGCTSFSLSNNNGVMDYTKYKVKYSNQDVHERHDGILEVGRLRGALGCEVFGKKGEERGEGDGTENKIGDEEEYWENEVVKNKWKDDSHDVGWGDDKKDYGLGLEKEIEGGWI